MSLEKKFVYPNDRASIFLGTHIFVKVWAKISALYLALTGFRYFRAFLYILSQIIENLTYPCSKRADGLG